MSRSLYRIARQALANKGFWGTSCAIIQRVGSTILQQFQRKRTEAVFASDRTDIIHPFDLSYGVDTSGLIWGENLCTPHPNAFWSTAYYGIAPSIFNQLIAELEMRLAPDWSSFTFLDLGSGKGRALMLASRVPFRAIAGVEISPELARIAQRNLATFRAPWQQCRSLASREGDAASVELPITPLVIYLYHPFAAPVLKAFLRNLEGSLQKHPRPVWLLYFNPALEKTITRHSAFERQFVISFTMREEDASADRFYTTAEPVAVYLHRPASGSAAISRSSTSP